MPVKRTFEEQLSALDALRQSPDPARLDPLRKALGNRNNLIVAKAADLVREFGLAELIPDLLKAFDRFFEHPEKSDPQCWAKNAISRALAAFELQDADVFLRGMAHIQMEPVWGGRSDTAGTLRATCALALVQCRKLQESALLAHLLELLADKDKSVRIEVARAIEQVGSTSSSFGGILRIDGTGPFHGSSASWPPATTQRAKLRWPSRALTPPKALKSCAISLAKLRTIGFVLYFCTLSLSRARMRHWNFCSSWCKPSHSTPRAPSRPSCARVHRMNWPDACKS
jgi:hypothetical protein